ncbi:hypothetical protein [Phaeacidiphilus oryzae]|uniref:hypothetical protein n=1 Tax=Phaeacidiphilus oryzae TaxID=348818 RepID=UPI00056A6FE2|nr:hypothetical protein [Phaeacidiphilus oryzae]
MPDEPTGTQTPQTPQQPPEGEPTEPQGQQPAEPTEPTEEPFDEARAKEKIRKANSENKALRERLKVAEPLAQRAKELEDAQKSELQRAQEAQQAAEERAKAAAIRAVRAEVRVLAADTFADPDDAAGALELGSYLGADGEIDSTAIKTELAALLERKPHWAKASGQRRPAPDPAQGSSANRRTASTPGDEFANFLTSALKGRGR